jgi:dihydropteroate synthase
MTTAPATHWTIRGRALALDRPIVAGVLNVTPDSFSDGGRYVAADAALAHAERMVAEGADMIDVGGESTRPQGAVQVDAEEELRRVVPVVARIAARFPGVVISIDTTKHEVAAAALDAGAAVVNDVSGLRLDPRIAEACAGRGAGLVLMHSRGGVSEMGTYRFAEYGDDPTGEVIAELRESLARASDGGVAASCIALDPGVGFAKRSEHSLRVLGELPRLVALGHPVLVGASRKRFVGEISRVAEPTARVNGTVGAHVAALMLGARIFRVHDVAAARQSLEVAWAVLRAGAEHAVGAEA